MTYFYYNNGIVRFNMVNSVNLAGREISVMKRPEELSEGQSCIIRCLRARNVDKLKILMERNNVMTNHPVFRTIYASSGLILWRKIGFAENFYVDNEKLKERWRKNYDDCLIGHDLIVDIDSREPEKFDKARETAEKIKGLFDRMEVPYGINFSGLKGFHIRIPWDFIRQGFRKLKPIDAEPLYRNFLEGLVEYLDLDNEFVDRSTLFRRQPVRVPYSIHSSGYVCLPLTDYQFKNFKIKMAKPKNVMALNLHDKEKFFDRKGYNRGMCYRYGDFNKMKKLIEGLAYA